MYTYTCVSLSLYIYIYTHIHTYIHTYIHTSLSITHLYYTYNYTPPIMASLSSNKPSTSLNILLLYHYVFLSILLLNHSYLLLLLYSMASLSKTLMSLTECGEYDFLI